MTSPKNPALIPTLTGSLRKKTKKLMLNLDRNGEPKLQAPLLPLASLVRQLQNVNRSPN